MAAAYAALVSLMNLIRDLQHHPSPPISLHHQPLHPITQHIIFFLDFLQAYIPPSVADDDESADPLEMRIANAAYAAEDAIESHIVDTIQSLQNHTDPQLLISTELINESDVMIKSINLCRVRLQNVIKEMDSINNFVADTEEKKKKMVAVHDQVPMKSVITSVSASSQETTVGLDDASREIMENLTGGQSDLRVTPIVGMGGIGKTFLAKSIYDKPLIKGHFVICAWATISQQYNTTEILCEILSQATKQDKEGLSGMSEDKLGLNLRKFLFGRRFLIVLDDMWSVDAWDKTRRFFPNNENGSRVLVTTRLSQLCSQLNHDYSLQMSFLDKASSWDLFAGTVLGDKSFPLELKEIGEQIVDNCRGLPLSIVVVGGLLKKTDGTLASWKSIRDNMSSMVNMENDKHCLKLLKMSYNHMPVYLMPCLLYMGVFNEDEVIRVSILIKMWVSEGFVNQPNGEAMETTARGFLQELIDRNLILVDSLGETGKINYCKIHDLVRDLCLKEGQKNGLYHVIGNGNQPSQEMNTLRRIVIPKGKVCDDQLRSMSNARSVIWESGDVPPNLRLLRMLHDYELNQSNIGMHSMNALAFHLHVNLRHVAMSVEDGDMSSFLHSVSLLWNLQTIIVSCLQKTTLPPDFWKMPQFRHIEFYYMLLPQFTPSDEGDGEFIIMENLHTLRQSLKKLLLSMSDEFEWENMLEMIGLLPLLEKLRLAGGCFGTGKWETVEGQFPCLKYLELAWVDGLENWTAAEEGSILPRLEHLKLEGIDSLKEIPLELGNIDTLKEIVLEWCGDEALVKSAKEMVDEQVDSQGEGQLCFHVRIIVEKKDVYQSLRNLAGPYFEICTS